MIHITAGQVTLGSCSAKYQWVMVTAAEATVSEGAKSCVDIPS